MASNQNFGRYYETDGAGGWRDFDRLPRDIREIIDIAPYKLCVGERRRRLLKELCDGGSVASYRRALVEECCELIMEGALRTYGPEHPDARRSRLRRRREPRA